MEAVGSWSGESPEQAADRADNAETDLSTRTLPDKHLKKGIQRRSSGDGPVQ